MDSGDQREGLTETIWGSIAAGPEALAMSTALTLARSLRGAYVHMLFHRRIDVVRMLYVRDTL